MSVTPKHTSSILKGFTIVELLIVIVVIGILAAIIMVSYNGITAQAHVATAQQSLSDRSHIIARFKAENDRYPKTSSDATWIASNIQTGSGITYTGNTGTSYCIEYADGSTIYSVDQADLTPDASSCTTGPTPTVGAITQTGIPLTWTNASGITTNNVQCSTSSTYAANSSSVSTVSSTGATSWTASGLQAGSKYYCHVQPIKNGVPGVYGSSATGTTTTPTVPTGLASASIAKTGFTLSWGATTGAWEYDVQCALSADTSYATVKFSKSGTASTNTAVTGLTASTSYICHVRTKGHTNSSAYSANLTVTTSS